MFTSSILSNNVCFYQSWKELATMGVSSRTGNVSLIYEKGDKEDTPNYRPMSLLNLAYIFCTTILKNHM